MSVMFSKVTLTADNGSAATLLCSGSPKDQYDLEDWTNYQKFMLDNLDSKSVKAEVDTYLYGEGEVYIANIYEVAAFTGRGEQFLHHPDVHWQRSSEFSVYPPLLSKRKTASENRTLSQVFEII